MPTRALSLALTAAALAACGVPSFAQSPASAPAGPAAVSAAILEKTEILGLESWTRERFAKEALEHCKGRW